MIIQDEIMMIGELSAICIGDCPVSPPWTLEQDLALAGLLVAILFICVLACLYKPNVSKRQHMVIIILMIADVIFGGYCWCLMPMVML